MLDDPVDPVDLVDLQKWRILNRLHDRNETLYYRVWIDHIQEMSRILYMPTVGTVCQKYSSLFTALFSSCLPAPLLGPSSASPHQTHIRRPRGMYFSAADRGEMASMVRNWPAGKVDVIVMTDGSKVLGLGDLGVQAIPIPCWEAGRPVDVIVMTDGSKVDVIVMTDGSKVLGLGDLGVQAIAIPVGKLDMPGELGGTEGLVSGAPGESGVTDWFRKIDLGVQAIAIPVGKLDMYVAAAGIPPNRAMAIPVGKLHMYVAAALIPPNRVSGGAANISVNECLMFDVGTNNEALIKNPLYLGLRHPRLDGEHYLSLMDEFMEAVFVEPSTHPSTSQPIPAHSHPFSPILTHSDLGLRHPRLDGEHYLSLMDEFMEAVFSRWPNVIVQVGSTRSGSIFWCVQVSPGLGALPLSHGRVHGSRLLSLAQRDRAVVQAVGGRALKGGCECMWAAGANALMDRYKSQYRIFNDDIEGTGGVAVAGILNVLRAQHLPLSAPYGTGGVAVAGILNGTGGVAVAGILNVLRAQHLPPKALADTRVVVAGTGRYEVGRDGKAGGEGQGEEQGQLTGRYMLRVQHLSPKAFADTRVVVAGTGRCGVVGGRDEKDALTGTDWEAEGVLTAVRRAMAVQIGQGKAAMDRAAENFWLVDDQGLMTDARGLMTDARVSCASEFEDFLRREDEDERLKEGTRVSCALEFEDFLRRSNEDERLKEGTSLAHVVKRVKPHVLVGLTGSGHLFDDDVLKAMKNADVSRPAVFALSQPVKQVKQGEALGDCWLAKGRKLSGVGLTGSSVWAHLFDDGVLKAMKNADVSRPAVFALSQPVKQAECTAQDAFKLLGPNALFASGCTFPDVRFLLLLPATPLLPSSPLFTNCCTFLDVRFRESCSCLQPPCYPPLPSSPTAAPSRTSDAVSPAPACSPSGMPLWYAPLVCPSGMPLWYAPLVCPSGMPLWYAPLVCPSGMPLWYAPLVCPSGMPLWYAPLVCPSGMPLWYAPLVCPSGMPLWYAPLVCPSGMPLWYAPLVCPSGMPLWYAPLVCPSGMPLWYAPLVCPSGMPLWYAPLVCPSGMPLWYAPLVCPSGMPLLSSPSTRAKPPTCSCL
ncbi:unnamed protein product [Closterium sp. Naga37s-1]|nr:unnamed protein product [Closterium sp. Naga37s-1]